MKTKTGYREWSGTQVDIQRGCENNCLYCFAAFDCVHRFKRCTAEQWACPVINQKKVDAKYPLYKDEPAPSDFSGKEEKSLTTRGFRKAQPVMFPSRHDITTLNVNECLCVLKKLLDADNNVLIVTKPHWNVVPLMCEALLEYRRQIVWRFTIGSTSDETLKFWEPGAAGFQERLSCLQYAFQKGYETSVSCEPCLDGLAAEYVYAATVEYITDSFWIGLLRNFKSRVDLKDVAYEQIAKFIRPLQIFNDSKMCVNALYELFKDKPYIKWKDSIRKIIAPSKFSPRGGKLLDNSGVSTKGLKEAKNG